MSHALKIACIAFSLSGCLFQEPSQPSLKCDADNPCPSGQACVASLCTGIIVGDGDAASSDMVDGSTVNSTGCAIDNGYVVGAKAVACPGACNQGQCDKLCGTGWQVCNDAAGINLALVKGLPGFYIANQPGYFFDPIRSQVSCGLATTPARPVFFGAGKSQANVTDSPGKPCGAFTQSADCGSAPLKFLCTAPFDLTRLAIVDAESGVLCCKP